MTQEEQSPTPEGTGAEASADTKTGDDAAKLESADGDGTTDPNGTARPELDLDGRLRPAFVLLLPDDPQLNQLVAAFERGDFLYVRQNAELVAKETTDEKVREAALDLRRRIDPDPLLKLFLATSAALLVFLIAWTYW